VYTPAVHQLDGGDSRHAAQPRLATCIPFAADVHKRIPGLKFPLAGAHHGNERIQYHYQEIMT
jgi:hypothetical protein